MHPARWASIAALAIVTVLGAACSGDRTGATPATATAAPGTATKAGTAAASPAASGAAAAKAEIREFTLPSLTSRR